MTQPNWPFLGLRDPISSSTHAAAFLCAILATLFLVRLARRHGVRSLSLAVFGFSLMFLYGASATYHALQLPPNGIKFFKLLDHSAIYLLIAGTHAAISRLLPQTGFQRGLLAVVWTVAVIGIGSEWLLPAPPYSLTVSVYVFMGWLVVLTLMPLLQTVGLRGVQWLVYGGLAYPTGALVDLLAWPVVLPGA